MKLKFTSVILMLLMGMSISKAQQQEKSMVSYTHFLLYIPENIADNGLYPLLLFLHGSGERGSDLNLLKKHGPPSFLDQNSDFPFVVVSPQCPENKNWDAQNLLALLDHVESILPIDKNKIYITGLSMGGYGTWDLCQAAPHRFAAIAPICGGGNLERLCIMRDVPVWVFHGAKDMAVPYQESERLVNKLKDFDSDVKYTLYPELGHDSWTKTYQNQELYDWFLSKTKNQTGPDIADEILESYAGSYRYSDYEIIEVIYNNNDLFVKSSVAGRKLQLVPITSTKFRISGLFSGDSDMYFKVTNKGVVEGFTVGPCDHTYCPLIKK